MLASKIHSEPAAALEQQRSLAQPLASPAELGRSQPCTTRMARTVETGRAAIRSVLRGNDPRFLVIAGPCSLHSHESALDYATRLTELEAEVGDVLVIAMRTYFEKPRTRLGWKGLIHDPHLDGSGDVGAGIELARRILLDITSLGLPCATELLDPLVARYVEDALAWGGIGARTCESQPHRELASDLPLPVGIKNTTTGDPSTAIDAVISARAEHTTVAIGTDGLPRRRKTAGNPEAHLVLRGGDSGPNFDRSTIERVRQALGRNAQERPVLIDCSHGNSGKAHERQRGVFEAVLATHVAARGTGANSGIAGVLLESHLLEGRQAWTAGASTGAPDAGRSITDSCIGWGETRDILLEAAHVLRRARA